MTEKLPAAERVKRESNYLRGTISESLADMATGAISENDTMLTKFHGTYQQDDRDVRDERRRQKLEPLYQFMVRLRLPGGVLTPEQWLGLDEIADDCANGTLRLTTRQTFQFHGVYKEKMRPLMQKVTDLGLDTRGACGDVNRNVIANVNPHESQVHAEVHRLSQEISERLKWRSGAYAEIWLGKECVQRMGEEEEEPFYGHKYLPRKFKIAIAVPPENDCDVFANDIALIAIVEKGAIVGYNVAVGGGMGMSYGAPETYPRLASMAGFIPAGQVVDACEAIAAIQRDHGCRTNRAHARFKYTMDDHGTDWFLEKFAEYHGQALEEPRPFSLDHNGDRFGWIEGENGNFHLTVFVESGRVADFDGRPLRTALRELARVHTGEFRVTCNQNLILANITPQQRPVIEQLVEKYQLDDGSRGSPLKHHAMSCVAFPTCALAMAEAERFLPAFVDRVEQVMVEAGLARDAVNLRVTGCPNGCARPYLGEIGLTGKAIGKYNLYLGADFSGQRMNRLYRENIDEDTIIETLQPMFEAYARERQSGERFGDFLHRTGIIEPSTGPEVFHRAAAD